MLKQNSIKIWEVQTKNKHTNSQNESVICYNGKKPARILTVLFSAVQNCKWRKGIVHIVG